ncbi:unnamed protein product, partial [Timema podura]|nr:unnamed protein product [Timema podura]
MSRSSTKVCHSGNTQDLDPVGSSLKADYITWTKRNLTQCVVALIYLAASRNKKVDIVLICHSAVTASYYPSGLYAYSLCSLGATQPPKTNAFPADVNGIPSVLLNSADTKLHHERSLGVGILAVDGCDGQDDTQDNSLHQPFLKYDVQLPQLQDFTFCLWFKTLNFTYPHPLFSYSS